MKLLKLVYKYFKKIQKINFKNLSSIYPINIDFGFSMGQPVDRYYIDKFLSDHSKIIHGTVLEISENFYTKKFSSGRFQSIVLSYEPGVNVDIVCNLEGENIPYSNLADVIIFTQTLNTTFEISNVVKNLHQLLRKNGILMMTAPGISQISRYDMDRWGEYWRFTSKSIERILEKEFHKFEVKTYGNVYAAISFLHGLPVEQLSIDKLSYHDPDFQVLIAAVAYK